MGRDAGGDRRGDWAAITVLRDDSRARSVDDIQVRRLTWLVRTHSQRRGKEHWRAHVGQRHAVIYLGVVDPLLHEAGHVSTVPTPLARALSRGGGAGDGRRRAVPANLVRRRHDRRGQGGARRHRDVGLDLHACRPRRVRRVEHELCRHDGRVVQDRRRVEVRLPVIRAAPFRTDHDRG